MKITNLLLLAGAAYLYQKTKKAMTLGDSYWDQYSNVPGDGSISYGAGGKKDSYQSNDPVVNAYNSGGDVVAAYREQNWGTSAPRPTPSEPSPSIELPLTFEATPKPIVAPPAKKRKEWNVPVADDAYYAALRESERLRAEQKSSKKAKSIDQIFQAASTPAPALPSLTADRAYAPGEVPSDEELVRREGLLSKASQPYDRELDVFMQNEARRARNAAYYAQIARERALMLNRAIREEAKYGPQNLTQSARAAVDREMYRRQVSPGGRPTQVQKTPKVVVATKCTNAKGCVTTAL